MINASVVCSLLTEKFSQSTGSRKISLQSPSAREEEVTNHLAELLNTIINCHEFTVESEISLDYISDDLTEDEIDQYAVSEDSELDPDFNDTDNDDSDDLLQKFSLDYMKKVIEYYDERNPLTGKRRRSWKGVKRRFKRVTHSSYISRFRAYIEKGGTRTQKWENINNYVYHKFEQARESNLPVITTKQVTSKEEVQHSADEFVSTVRNLLPKYNPDYVINTDQSGIQLEFYSTRTLSFKGERSTAINVRSKNATTHSFTVQPCVRLSGKLVGPLFLCLKEPAGYLSENVRGRLFKAPNIVVSCSKSGKLTTDLVKFWRDNVLLPSIASHHTLLISDCWPGQSNITGIYDNINKLYRLELPKHTTTQIQPLDLFYNNQHKYIARRMFDRVLLDGLDINLSE
ncbi:unnamed protein product, partial [Rotaria sordida]